MNNDDDITYSHQQDLNKTRQLISNLINELSLFSTGEKNKESDIEYWNLMWGDKENITSVMSKLSTMLLKIIPLEQELSMKSLDLTKNSEDIPMKIEESDREIIKRYVKKYSSHCE